MGKIQRILKQVIHAIALALYFSNFTPILLDDLLLTQHERL